MNVSYARQIPLGHSSRVCDISCVFLLNTEPLNTYSFILISKHSTWVAHITVSWLIRVTFSMVVTVLHTSVWTILK